MAETPPRELKTTSQFRRWVQTLDGDRTERVNGAIRHAARSGPTLGRPHVDVIHGSRVRKLKEVRVDRSIRVLFAFDSNRNAVMLVGGDKSGKWSRWYPQQVRLAERLLGDHERSIGKDTRWLSQQTQRAASHRTR